MENNNPLPTEAGSGYLMVQVTTANGALPLEGAAVTVRSEADGTLLYALKSGSDGRTARVALATPPRQMALDPDAGRPYTPYRIEVIADGFTRMEYTGVPIFDGITAVQQAVLAPLPEAGYTDGFTLSAPEIRISESGARL